MGVGDMEQVKKVTVPVVDGRMIENGTGTNKDECFANLTFIELSDDEWKRLEFWTATLTLDEDD